MATKKPSLPKKLSPITWILIGVIAVMVVLLVFMAGAVSAITSRDARANMQTIASQHAKVIADYASWAEDTIDYFAYASQIRELLENPNDKEALAAAQKLTDEYGEDVGELEGLYIAGWDGMTLTHINHDTIGTPVREGGRLTDLQETFDKLYDPETHDNQVYNAGMLTSPSTGKQVVAVYKCIRDNSGKGIGFVGLAIYTENLLNDLSDTEISGLENASFILVDTDTNNFLYTEDKSQIGKVCGIPDIQQINQQLMSKQAENTGIGTFIDTSNSVKTVSAYDYISDYNWTLLVNAPYNDVYSMTHQLQYFVLIFGILMILLIIVFGIVNAHQEAVNRRLGKQILKNEATQESLQTAMFKDILTEVQNRVAFTEDLDNANPDADHPCYFAMFDVSELSVINTQFGNDAGDAVLCNTAEILKKSFPDGTVYRTGSDEFVVAMKKDDNSTATYNQVFRSVTEAHGELLKPQETPDGSINVGYKIALVRSTSDLSTTVIAVLKDIANRSGRTAFGQVNFVDMDTL